jgi:hypothetical protein
MRFLRVVSGPTDFAEWQLVEPRLSKLFLSFDIQPRSSQIPPTSVFRVESELEALESAAAVFQKTGAKPDKLGGVLVTEQDCRDAGIRIVSQEGGTGIRHVDNRHADLVGDSEQFKELFIIIIKRVWEGQDRLRMFPARQLSGQIAVFSKLPQGYIREESRETCERSLQKANCHQFDHAQRRVEILGRLDAKPSCEVRASRSYDTSSSFGSPSIGSRPMGFIKRLCPRWLNDLMSRADRK